MSEKKHDKSATVIAIVICVAGLGLIAYGLLWVAYQIGKLVWG